jgi:predicted tellurium resistance membrane protein TerC
MSFIKLIGGAVIIWIAVKLLTEGAKEECQEKECGSLWQALWVIIVADLSMGIDNMLAVGAASHGSMFLLIFGLGLSIPFVVFMSNMLSKLMDRYPIILWIGAAILGRVGGEMMITDPLVQTLLQPPTWIAYAIELFFVILSAAGCCCCGSAKRPAGRGCCADRRRRRSVGPAQRPRCAGRHAQ